MIPGPKLRDSLPHGGHFLTSTIPFSEAGLIVGQAGEMMQTGFQDAQATFRVCHQVTINTRVSIYADDGVMAGGLMVV